MPNNINSNFIPSLTDIYVDPRHNTDQKIGFDGQPLQTGTAKKFNNSYTQGHEFHAPLFPRRHIFKLAGFRGFAETWHYAQLLNIKEPDLEAINSQLPIEFKPEEQEEVLKLIGEARVNGSFIKYSELILKKA